MRESKGAGGLLNVHDKIIAYMPRTPSRKHSSSPPLPHKKFSEVKGNAVNQVMSEVYNHVNAYRYWRCYVVLSNKQ